MDGKSRNDWAVRFTLYNQHITAVCTRTCLTRKKKTTVAVVVFFLHLFSLITSSYLSYDHQTCPFPLLSPFSLLKVKSCDSFSPWVLLNLPTTWRVCVCTAMPLRLAFYTKSMLCAHSHTNILAPAKEEGGMERGKEWENGQHHKSECWHGLWRRYCCLKSRSCQAG